MPHDLKKIWMTLAPAERRKSLGMLALIVLMALAETIGVVSIMPFLAVLGRPAVIHENAALAAAYQKLGFHDTRGFIFALGIASIVLVVVSSAFKTITLHIVNRFAQMQRHSLSTRLLAVYLRQPYEFFLARNPSTLSKNVLSEVDQLVFQLLQPLSQLIAQGVVVLAMTALIVCYDPRMAMVLVLIVLVLYGSIYLLARKRLARIGAALQDANTGRYKACNEAIGGIKDIKISHAADAYLDEFSRASREFSRHSATSETIAASPLYLVEATGYSSLILIALVLVARSNDIAHVLPALGLYGFAAYRLLPAVQVMYRGFTRLRFSSPALDSIHRDLALPVPAIGDGDAESMRPQREIRLHGIRFAYPAAPDKPVLDDINLVIPANTSVGLAGKSGAGKSTVMDILLGLLDPQAGHLSVDGITIGPANLAAWQRSIGYVPQHIYLADASVAQNIAFGVPARDIDMRAVERAARTAQIHDFVANELPQGYATLVGDRGIRLSGGQRQRVGIARALYRDPPVLFFDEATSALDSQTEEAVNDAIRSLSGNKTIVVIAHKETSLRDCDRIVDLASSEPRALPPTAQ